MKFTILQIVWMPFAWAAMAVFGLQCAAHHVPAYIFIPCVFPVAAALGLLPWGVRRAMPRLFDGE